MRQDLSHLAAFCALVAHASLSAAAPASDTFDKRGGNPDYVIVGGGSAGFVLAEQLSRNPSVSVVLLESGPQNADIDAINIPGYAAMLLDTPSTYNYSCQPDPNIGGRRQALHQGRGFGGGSAVNYMGSAIGAPSVYDEWAAISGDPGLRWENIQKAFKAVYHYTEYPLDYEPYVNEDAYGTGPVELTSPTDNLGFVQELAAAWRSVLDIEWADPNDGTGVGLFSGTTNVRASNKTRVFAAQAFGWQLAGRPNAQQLYNAEVIKIGFTGTRATSVTYVNPITGARKTLYPKEVILSAGAFGSPKLLMLSGVGPANHLTSLGIRVVKDIPQVGQNFYDHHFSVMSFEVTGDVRSLWQCLFNSTYAPIARAQYDIDGSGPLGVPNGVAFATTRVPDSVFEAVNDTFHPSLPADRGHLIFQYSSSPLLPDYAGNVTMVSPFVSLVQPELPGHMELTSADYRDQPKIFTNYFASPGDKAAIIYGYKELLKVVKHPSIAPKFVRQIYPPFEVETDEDVWDAIAAGSLTFHHPLGTVALGKVVQGKTFRIKGLQGIRVIDSSSIPTMPTSHLMAPTYAYAYYAAQKIKEQDRYI